MSRVVKSESKNYRCALCGKRSVLSRLNWYQQYNEKTLVKDGSLLFLVHPRCYTRYQQRMDKLIKKVAQKNQTQRDGVLKIKDFWVEDK